MAVQGTIAVRCPACRSEQEATLVQSINARLNPELAQKLLAGELNVLDCPCGKRTQLLATLLYHDPDRDYFCQACPGGDDVMVVGARAFEAIGEVGTRRLVPTQNALVEKVKLLDAGLEDTVVEVLKVLLLASRGDDTSSILLFDRVDRAANAIVWYLLEAKQVLTSPLPAYDKLAATLAPSGGELRVDRAWALEAARAMISRAN